MTIQDKNKIIKKHYKNMGVEVVKKLHNQSLPLKEQ